MIGIINYGSGNVSAIGNIYKSLKIPFIISNDSRELEKAERYILPGVGAFDATMTHLKNSGIQEMLTDQVRIKKKKILGICVGMQILGDSSDEGTLSGLGWIPGHVRRLNAGAFPTYSRLPHMGWNSVCSVQGGGLFDGVDHQRGFYFLHSYYFDVLGEDCVAATVHYGKKFPCAVVRGNVFGLQFHPEKSHTNGVTIFRNFAGL